MKIDECYFNKKNKLKKRHKNENKCYFNEEKNTGKYFIPIFYSQNIMALMWCIVGFFSVKVIQGCHSISISQFPGFLMTFP